MTTAIVVFAAGASFSAPVAATPGQPPVPPAATSAPEQSPNTDAPHPLPVRVSEEGDLVDLVAVGHRMCVTRADRTRRCWNPGVDPHQGAGNEPAWHPVPEEVLWDLAADPRWTRVSVGLDHACGLRSDSSLWCWGGNAHGQLGDGTEEDQVSPVRVGNRRWTDLATGHFHTCGLQDDGSLWCWGDGDEGQTGEPESGVDHPTPHRVNPHTWTDVDTSELHTYAVRADGTLWGWGLSHYSATPAGPDGALQIGTAAGWVRMIAGTFHHCGIQDDGSAWCWGENLHGKLGDGTTQSTADPTRVAADGRWQNLSLGMDHTCGVRTDHSLWCWGSNSFGQLGDGTLTDRTVPTRVGEADTSWLGVVAGENHTCGLRDDGTLWCWGQITEVR